MRVKIFALTNCEKVELMRVFALAMCAREVFLILPKD